MRYFTALLLFASFLSAQEVSVVRHEDVPVHFFNNGTYLQGIATESLGSHQFEVWRSSLSVGACTPRHKHECEEVFVFLKGEAKIVVGEEEYYLEAPCSLVCPANIEHQIFNVGDIPTDQIVILGIGTKIFNTENKELSLPWRE